MAAFTPTGVQLLVKGAGEFFGTMAKANSKIVGFGKTIGKAAVGGLVAFGAATTGVAVASLKAAVDYETAFAGVIKTTDGLVDEMGDLTEEGEKMSDGFRDLAKEVPTAVEELLAIGELGGQLGIAKENLLDFTKTIAAMGEATNLTTEEAASGFAQIANVMGTPQARIENMGSSVVELGNNFATTERDILAFAQRIAGAGKIAGLTESDVFAIGAAFSSVGVQAEAGGTAVQKVLLGMNQAVLDGGEQLEIFSATAGLSAEEFAGLWERDAAEGFRSFVSGLGMAGDDAINILSALGLEDQRLIRSFLSLAGAGDLLANAIDSSGDAFAENTALTKEAEARYRTTAAQFDIFKNTIKDVGISIGQALLPFVNKLLKKAQPLIDELGKKLPSFLEGTLIPAIEGVVQWLGVFLPQAITFVSNFWTNTLQPALNAFITFATTVLIPLFSQIVSWLVTNIPLAIQTVSGFWTGILQPALQTVFEFIQTNIIPIFQMVANWLSVAIPAAITILTGIWNTVLLPAIEAIKPVVQEVIGFVITTFQGLVAWVQENWPAIKATIETVMMAVQQFIQNVLGVIEALWNEHGARILAFITVAWEGIKTRIQAAITIVQQIITAIMAAIQGDWDAVWAAIKEIANQVWTIIVSTIETALEALKTIIPVALSIIQTVIAAAWNAIKALTAAAWEVIKRAVSDAMENLKGVLKGGLDVARAVVQVAMDAVRRLFSSAWDKIKEVFQSGIDKAKNILSGAKDAFLNAGKAIVDNIRKGIESAWGELVGWFKSRLDDLKGLLPFSEPKSQDSPLRGLGRAGAAIVRNVTAGMQQAVRQLEATELQMAGALGGSALGGTATPVFAAGGGTTNNITVSNQFNASINNGMDRTAFEAGVLRVVSEALTQRS